MLSSKLVILGELSLLTIGSLYSKLFCRSYLFIIFKRFQVSGTRVILGDLQRGGAGLVGKGPDTEAGGIGIIAF